MKLYIGNATKQTIDFSYRLRDQGVKLSKVPIGGQVMVGSDLLSVEIDAIIDQHTRYGLVPIEEAERTENFSGMCYSVDKPITADRLQRAMDARTDVLVDVGKKLREESAVASNNFIERQTDEQPGLGQLRHLAVSVTEQPNSSDRSERATGAYSESMVVKRSEDNNPRAERNRQANGGKRAARRARTSA